MVVWGLCWCIIQVTPFLWLPEDSFVEIKCSGWKLKVVWLQASITAETVLVWFPLYFRLEKVYNLVKEHLTPKKQESQSGKWNCVDYLETHASLYFWVIFCCFSLFLSVLCLILSLSCNFFCIIWDNLVFTNISDVSGDTSLLWQSMEGLLGTGDSIW